MAEVWEELELIEPEIDARIVVAAKQMERTAAFRVSVQSCIDATARIKAIESDTSEHEDVRWRGQEYAKVAAMVAPSLDDQNLGVALAIIGPLLGVREFWILEAMGE